jgi:HD-like signal output (HDOD) protein
MQPSLINWTLNTINPQLDSFTPPKDMRETISRIQTLPPLPGVALRIMQLAADPLADAAKLATIVELDPLLTAQVIRWASSPLYGYRGKITGVQQAISQVLGFDFVFNLALGLAALAPLKAPMDGPIGTRLFWIQALASTRLLRLLGDQMPIENRLAPAQLFLVGLLHNIGFPLLGDQFPEEFSYLNNLILANPNLTVFNLEKFAFGVDHTMLGAWLMSAWCMPKPIIDVVYHHHNPNYRGENNELNLLVYLNDCLLGKLGIGDAQSQLCEEEIFMQLNLPVAAANETLDQLNDILANIITTADMITS